MGPDFHRDDEFLAVVPAGDVFTASPSSSLLRSRSSHSSSRRKPGPMPCVAHRLPRDGEAARRNRYYTAQRPTERPRKAWVPIFIGMTNLLAVIHLRHGVDFARVAL